MGTKASVRKAAFGGREPAGEILSAAEGSPHRLTGAGRGNRTPTVLSDLRILSPLRLPISPSRQRFLIVVSIV